MNGRVTLGFLAALALLAGLVFGLERSGVGQAPAKDAAKDEELTVFQFDDRKATALTVRSGEKAVRFEKSGEQDWKIAETGEAANRITVTNYLIRLGQLKGTRRIAEGADLKSFGLAEPKSEATAEIEGAEPATLQLGDRTPVGTGVYARKGGTDQVFIVATALATDLERLVAEPKEVPTPVPTTAVPTAPPAPEGPATGTSTPTP